MKSQDIHIDDLRRILVGEVPMAFFVELVIRVLIIFMILLISMRLMGKRMSSQLSRNELAALVSLAAGIGVPLMAPDRGLLPAIVIAFVLIYIQKFIAGAAFKSQSFEKFSQGNVSTLVKDAVIDRKVLKSVHLSPERLYAQLRSQGILQLGAVKRFYMEANGTFTLIKNEKPGAGLSILPTSDEEFIKSFRQLNDAMVCGFCGTMKKLPFDTKMNCSHCGKLNWVNAVSDEHK